MSTSTENKEKKSFWQWLIEDDSPEIGIAAKESFPDYIKGVQYEFKKIDWPSQGQIKSEFVAILIIVAIIALTVYLMDLGIAKIFDFFLRG